MRSTTDRWILGPCEEFVSGPHMIVSVNGIAIIVQRPPHQFLEEASGSDAGTHYAGSPEPQCKTKVPRPPNAYILYRKDHHAKVKKLDSQLTNNQICELPCVFSPPHFLTWRSRHSRESLEQRVA